MREIESYIHTGIASKSKVAELPHEEVLSEPRHLLTPMCGAKDPERDQCWSITENAVEHIESQYKSNAEEADTRVWLHAKHSAGERKPPDTDVYHIGLRCANLTSTEVIIQLSSTGRELKLLHLNELDNAIKSDPDLHFLPQEKWNETVYVCTGCHFFLGLVR